MYIVGTAMNSVILGLVESERRERTSGAEKGKRNSTDPPARRGTKRALRMPWTWCRGRMCRRRSVGEYFHAWERAEDWWEREEWVVTTPFCVPSARDIIEKAGGTYGEVGGAGGVDH